MSQVHPRHLALWIYLISGLCLFALTLLIYRNSVPSVKLQESSTRVLSTSDSYIKTLPVRLNDNPAPTLTAQSVIVFDPDSNTIIFSKNAETELPMASTTKIMTALTALEAYSLDYPVTVTNANESVGSKAEIQPGETWSVLSLLYALMLPSGNDAAVALAETYPGGYTAFVNLMNDKSRALYLTHTHFTNVSGIDQPGHYSTARDLALLTQAAMKLSQFRTIVQTKKITLATADQSVSRTFINLNELLGEVPGVIGVKTGKSDEAGECLITYVTRDSHAIITVILGSESRFTESKSLIDWVYQTYEWQTGAALN